MKVKGKIVQIIKEEDNKNYGIPKTPNTDWLNIRPNPEFKTKAYTWGIILFIVGFGLGALINVFTNKAYIIFPSVLVPWLIAAYLFFKQNKENAKIFPGAIWPFDAPFPVEKPHNYNVYDEVEINIDIKK